ncbi:oligosaccharide flippase family protein [Palleronia sediminis]|nr:oligosaccharide flippase family protein [Palleronia sediminis]
MAGFAFSARATQQVSAFVITLLAARFLLPAEYGVYTLSVVFVMFIQMMTYTGFYHFIINDKAEDDAVLSTSFWLIVGLASGASGLIALAAPMLARVFDAPALGPVLLLLIAAQPLAAVSAWYTAALLRRRAMRAHYVIMFAQNLAALVGGAVLLWSWQSVMALVAFRYLRVLVGLVLYFAVSPDRPHLRFDPALARRAMRFASGLYGAKGMEFLSRYSADLLLGLMFSTAEAGLYRFGSRIATAATDIVTSTMQAFALTQFGAAARADGDLAAVLRRFTGTITLLTGGVAAVIVVLVDDVVTAFFDPAYLAAVAVAYAIAVRAAVKTGSVLIAPALAAAGRTGAVMSFATLSMVVSVAATFGAAPFGLVAVAWGQAAATMVLTFAGLWWLRRRTGMRIGGAVRAFAVAGALALTYGAVLELGVVWIGAAAGLSPVAEIWAGMALAAVLAVPTLFAGRALRVFTLGVFSG